MVSENNDSFVSSFTSLILCFSLIALEETLHTVLNRSSDSQLPCLIPNLREKAFDILPVNMFPLGCS